MEKSKKSLNRKRLKRKDMGKKVRFFQLFIISILILLIAVYLKFEIILVLIGLIVAFILIYFYKDFEKLFLL